MPVISGTAKTQVVLLIFFSQRYGDFSGKVEPEVVAIPADARPPKIAEGRRPQIPGVTDIRDYVRSDVLVEVFTEARRGQLEEQRIIQQQNELIAQMETGVKAEIEIEKAQLRAATGDVLAEVEKIPGREVRETARRRIVQSTEQTEKKLDRRQTAKLNLIRAQLAQEEQRRRKKKK